MLADAFDQLAAEVSGALARSAHSSAFYNGMTVLAVVLFAAFLAIVIGLSL